MCEWGPAATARLLLSPSVVESTPVLHDSQLLDPSVFGYFRILQYLNIFVVMFPRGATAGVSFLPEATLSQPACLLGPD